MLYGTTKLSYDPGAFAQQDAFVAERDGVGIAVDDRHAQTVPTTSTTPGASTPATTLVIFASLAADAFSFN